tara:strand:- start:1213 stop:1524 length:312 start_codon:yes stop_codon:yes gene_type:complete
MSNKNLKHEVLTFMHLLRHNAIEQCETDTDKIAFFYDFAEAVGMNFSKHFGDAKNQLGEQIATHMMMAFLDTACAVNPDFAVVMRGVFDRHFSETPEKQEYLN